MEHVPLDEVRRQFEVDVFGQIAVTQALLPLIRKARGRIVNMGSVGGQIAMPFGGVLCGCKSALHAMNDALRLELRPWGIHVCLIEPGGIRTPAVEKTLGDIERARRCRPMAARTTARCCARSTDGRTSASAAAALPMSSHGRCITR